MVFFHPQPVAGFHVILMPRRRMRTMQALTDRHPEACVRLFQLAEQVAAQYQLAPHGYRLVINQGKYQDVAQFHAHLLSEHSPSTGVS